MNERKQGKWEKNRQCIAGNRVFWSKTRDLHFVSVAVATGPSKKEGKQLKVGGKKVFHPNFTIVACIGLPRHNSGTYCSRHPHSRKPHRYSKKRRAQVVFRSAIPLFAANAARLIAQIVSRQLLFIITIELSFSLLFSRPLTITTKFTYSDQVFGNRRNM